MEWGPVVAHSDQYQAWWKPAKNQLKCAHCGVLVKPKGKHDKLQLFLFGVTTLSLSSYVSPASIGNCSYGATFVGVAACIFLLVNALSKKI